MKRVPASFFHRAADAVARDLLGCVLVVETRCAGKGRKKREKIERHIIHETEAYLGPHDLASHASKGRTARTDVMYRAAGTIYVYLVYGMHTMLNVVTGDEGDPAAVLIRSAGLYEGPGKLTKALGISRAQNGMALGNASGIWIEGAPRGVDSRDIRATPRVGVAYAGAWARKKLRFVLADAPRPC